MDYVISGNFGSISLWKSKCDEHIFEYSASQKQLFSNSVHIWCRFRTKNLIVIINTFQRQRVSNDSLKCIFKMYTYNIAIH